MVLSGIADEAGKDIATQVKAHKELGLHHIELRLVNGQNVAGELPDREFDEVCACIEDAGIQVTGFASRIANWSRHIKDDFDIDVQDLRATLPRMKRLNVKHTRVMSWKGDGVSEEEWRDIAVKRLKELTDIAAQEGIVLAHENCTGWGGLSAENMVALKEAIDHPNFVLLYDMGNTISHGYEPVHFFNVIRKQFDYIHIKDAHMTELGKRSEKYTYCGEGDAKLTDLLSIIIGEDGYDGVIAIEPHVSAVVHQSGPKPTPEAMYSSYIKYGNKFKEMMAQFTPVNHG